MTDEVRKKLFKLKKEGLSPHIIAERLGITKTTYYRVVRESEIPENVTVIPVTAWKLLPPAADKCQECAVNHEPDQPHDATSLYYGTHRRVHGHATANWNDAMAHCKPEVQAQWRKELEKMGIDVAGGKVRP